MLWKEFKSIEEFPEIFDDLSFYKIRGNLKNRLKAFVNDLRKYRYLFVNLFKWMNILSTQSGQLSFSQNDIDHIFKYEYIKKEYKNILTDPNDQFCIDESDHFIFNDNINDNEWNDNLLINNEYLYDKDFRQLMGLKIKLKSNDGNIDGIMFNDIDDLEKMDILYIYDAMDYEIYSKIVEYYWQDFVCFDYAAHYKHDVLDKLSLSQTKYPGFPIKNRTETNWDKILNYYYSKQRRKL